MFILSQGFFSFSCPASKKAGGAQEVGRGHRQDSWPKLAKGIFHTIWCHAQHIKLGGRRRKGETFGVVVFVFPSNLRVMEPCFPGDGWTPVCRWEAVNEFLVLLCLRAQLLLSLLNCLYLSPWVFLLLPFWFSPHPTSERAALWCLVAGWG